MNIILSLIPLFVSILNYNSSRTMLQKYQISKIIDKGHIKSLSKSSAWNKILLRFFLFLFNCRLPKNYTNPDLTEAFLALRGVSWVSQRRQKNSVSPVKLDDHIKIRPYQAQMVQWHSPRRKRCGVLWTYVCAVQDRGFQWQRRRLVATSEKLSGVQVMFNVSISI